MNRGWDGRGKEWGQVGGGGLETYFEPVDDVAVGWVAGAAGELFLASGVDDDRVFEGAFVKD